MIFIILGTQKFQLNRLLMEVDRLVAEGKITDKVFAQTGYSDYRPKYYEYVDFLDKPQFEQKIKMSSLVITHSGIGSIITAVKAKKDVIVYPRLKEYNEHIDDHQLEIAEVFTKKGFVLCCHKGEDLLGVIHKSSAHVYENYESSNDKIIDLINTYLLDLSGV